MLILNLGCGTKTSDRCVNVDWSIYLRIQRNVLIRFLALPFLGRERRAKLESLSRNVMVHDLRKPLPFASDSVDAVYHSHVLEHIDRDKVDGFLKEIHRVLRPGGIQRICVPDLESLARRYLDHITQCEQHPDSLSEHDHFVHDLLEQSVRKQAFGSGQQSSGRKIIENTLLGDARKRGETHQWMYDRFNLKNLLETSGFQDVEVRACNESDIPEWEEIGLELVDEGKEYIADWLYMECRK